VLACVLLIFIYATFDFKTYLHHEVYKYRTETLGVIKNYVYILCFLVEFRLLDLSVCACLRRAIKAICVMK